MKPALYVSRRLPPAVMARLQDEFRLTATPASEVAPVRQAVREGIRDADAAITTLTEQVDDEVLNAAAHLKVIANCAVGFNNISIEAARARGIIVTNTPDVLTEATADLTWALILAAARRVVEGDRLVRNGTWSGWDPNQLLGAEVSEKTLGIVGMGRIGRAVARRASGFAMPIIYCSRSTLDPTVARIAKDWQDWRRIPLDELLTQADFVTLHVPLTQDTRHLIGTRELSRMKSTAFLINTSRGPVVDEAALVSALREKRLAGAGLDVYEQEPKLHPGLAELPQVVLLPHLGSATLQTRVQMGMICLENIRAVLAGRRAPNRVA
jgi:glyoxylate reductase